MFQLRAAEPVRELASGDAGAGGCAVAAAGRHSLQSTFINWADESHGFHDECFCLIRATLRETFYRFSIKSVYYS